MATLLGSIVVMVVVFGTLVGWSVRKERRLKRAAEFEERVAR
jgi:hypothetical protein